MAEKVARPWLDKVEQLVKDYDVKGLQKMGFWCIEFWRAKAVNLTSSVKDLSISKKEFEAHFEYHIENDNNLCFKYQHEVFKIIIWVPKTESEKNYQKAITQAFAEK